MNDVVEIDDEETNTFEYKETENLEEQEPVKSVDDQQKKDDSKQDETEEYGKRVQKRINKLVYQVKSTEDENVDLKSRLANVEARLKEQDNARSKEEYEVNAKRIKAKKAELFEEDDFDGAAELDDELLDLKLKQREQNTQQTPKKQGEQNTNVQDKPLPKEQEKWLDQNDWFFNPSKNDKKQEANNTYLDMLDEGYDPDDSKTYVELDKRIKNVRPQKEVTPPTNAPDRGGAVGSSKQVKFTRADADAMAAWGIDPNNVEARKMWLNNKRREV